MPSHPIKNIIFDLGNVLIDIDVPKAYDNLSQVTGLDFHNLDDEAKSVFLKFETGKIPYVVFFNYITKISRRKAVINDLLPAWNSMLLQIQPETIELLQSLSSHYRLYILSNTNETHIQWLDRYLENLGIKQTWYHELFTKVYYSHLINRRKPDPSCFEYVLRDANILGKETLFIDDLSENIEGALEMQIDGLIYNRHKENLRDLLNKKLEYQN